MSITIKGVTSGGVDLKAPDTGSNTTVTLPSATGTLLPTDGNGSALTNLTSANLVGALPALSGANLTGLTSANLVGALPALDGSSLTGVAPTKATIDALGIAASSITGALPAIDGSSLTNMAAGGKVLQVVSATHSTQTTNNTGSYSSTGLTANITPSSTSSKIFISYQVPMYQDGNGGSSVSALHAIYKGGSVLQAFGAGWGMTSRSINYAYQCVGVYLDSPSTTSATTYTVYYRPYSTGSGQLIYSCPNTDGGMQPDSTASLVLMEVAS